MKAEEGDYRDSQGNLLNWFRPALTISGGLGTAAVIAYVIKNCRDIEQEIKEVEIFNRAERLEILTELILKGKLGRGDVSSIEEPIVEEVEDEDNLVKSLFIEATADEDIVELTDPYDYTGQCEDDLTLHISQKREENGDRSLILSYEYSFSRDKSSLSIADYIRNFNKIFDFVKQKCNFEDRNGPVAVKKCQVFTVYSKDETGSLDGQEMAEFLSLPEYFYDSDSKSGLSDFYLKIKNREITLADFENENKKFSEYVRYHVEPFGIKRVYFRPMVIMTYELSLPLRYVDDDDIDRGIDFEIGKSLLKYLSKTAIVSDRKSEIKKLSHMIFHPENFQPVFNWNLTKYFDLRDRYNMIEDVVPFDGDSPIIESDYFDY